MPITMQLPVFFAVLAASWVQGAESSKCNQTLICLIGTFNEIVPTNILENNFKLGPDWLAYTTKNFFPNEKELFSVVTDWTKDGQFTYYFYYKKDKPQDVVDGGKLTENDGYTYNEATETYQYHIRTTGLVDACYRCQENGKEGPPDGMMKVWKGYEEDDVKKAKKNIEQLLGRKLSVSYAQFSV